MSSNLASKNMIFSAIEPGEENPDFWSIHVCSETEPRSAKFQFEYFASVKNLLKRRPVKWAKIWSNCKFAAYTIDFIVHKTIRQYNVLH